MRKGQSAFAEFPMQYRPFQQPPIKKKRPGARRRSSRSHHSRLNQPAAVLLPALLSDVTIQVTLPDDVVYPVIKALGTGTAGGLFFHLSGFGKEKPINSVAVGVGIGTAFGLYEFYKLNQ